MNRISLALGLIVVVACVLWLAVGPRSAPADEDTLGSRADGGAIEAEAAPVGSGTTDGVTGAEGGEVAPADGQTTRSDLPESRWSDLGSDWYLDAEALAAFSAEYRGLLAWARQATEEYRQRPGVTKFFTESLEGVLSKDQRAPLGGSLHAEDFKGLPPDACAEAQRLLHRSARSWDKWKETDPGNEEYPLQKMLEQPLEYSPALLLRHFGGNDASSWSTDLVLEVSAIRKQAILDFVELGGEQFVLQGAIGKARQNVGLEHLRLQHYSQVSPEWARLDELRKAIQAHYLERIRTALAAHGG